MGFDPQDQEIIKLLAKLKNTGESYPENMLVARRQRFQRQMMEIGMGLGAGVALEQAGEAANASATSSTASSATSTLLETALVIAILVETGAVAYFYRDKIADFVRMNMTEARVQGVTDEASPPVVTTSTEILGVTPSPAVTATTPFATLSASPTNPSVTVSSTPIPGIADEDSNAVSGSSTSVGSSQVEGASTPIPSGNNTDNQGNHYGQTPKPERTKEKTDNNNNSAPDNNDDSSQNNDSPAPKQEPKPTKTK